LIQALQNKAMLGSATERLYTDSAYYTESLLYIVDKTNSLIPFYLNPVQKKIRQIKERVYRAAGTPWFLILKARRMGVTTDEQAQNFWLAATREHQNVWTIAHRTESTEEIFDIALMFYNHLLTEFRPFRKYENKRILNFNLLHSKFKIETAGAQDPGRGPRISRLHGSEVAFWRKADKIIAGLESALVPGGEFVVESTPNGTNNWFYQEYQRIKEGDSKFALIFMPWYADPTYQIPLDPGERLELSDEEKQVQRLHSLSLPQIKYRRDKQLSLKHFFNQEYPEDPDTCFEQLQGGVYTKYYVDILRPRGNLIEPFIVPPDWETYGGIDFGSGPGHPFVYGKLALSPHTGQGMFCFEYYKEGDLLRNHAQVIKHGNEINNPRCIWADPSGLQERRELKSLGIETYPGNNARKPGIDLVSWLLQPYPKLGEPLLLIFANCKNARREFKQYAWDEDKGEPMKANDHVMDQLRYMCMGILRLLRKQKRLNHPWLDYPGRITGD